MTISIIGVGTGVTGTGALTPTLPATPAVGDLILAFPAAAANAAVISTTAAYTALANGTQGGVLLQSVVLYGKIATASETAPQFTFGADGNAHGAHTLILRSSTGWQSIEDVVADHTAGGTSSLTTQTYAGMAVTEEGNYPLQWGIRNYADGNTSPVTTTTVAPGWSNAGRAIRNTVNSGMTSSAEINLTAATIAAGVAQNLMATTGNTTAGNQKRLTVTLRPQPPAITFLYDASQRIDSPYNLLPTELIALIGAFAVGDSYQQNGVLVGQGSVSPGNFGVATVTFNNPLTGLLWPGIFHDATGTGDGNYTYVMPLNPPPIEGLRLHVTRQGPWRRRRRMLSM